MNLSSIRAAEKTNFSPHGIGRDAFRKKKKKKFAKGGTSCRGEHRSARERYSCYGLASPWQVAKLVEACIPNLELLSSRPLLKVRPSGQAALRQPIAVYRPWNPDLRDNGSDIRAPGLGEKREEGICAPVGQACQEKVGLVSSERARQVVGECRLEANSVFPPGP